MYKIKLKAVIFFLVSFTLLLSTSVPAKTIVGKVVSDGAPVQNAIVEIVVLDGNPIYTTEPTPPEFNFNGGTLLYSAAVNAYYKTTTGTNGYIKSQTGNETGIFIAESDSTTPATKYLLVRAWSPDASKYGYSQSFLWGDALESNKTQDVGNISLIYFAKKPDPPTINLSFVGYDKDLKPLLSASFASSGYELITDKYQGILLQDSTDKDALVSMFDEAKKTDSSSFNVTTNLGAGKKIEVGKTYTLSAKAKTGFGVSDSNTSDPLTLPATPTPSLSHTLTLYPGINFISMPFAPSSPQNVWYANLNGTNKIFQIAQQFIGHINEAAGNINVVTSFGKWDNNGQKDAGTIIKYPLSQETPNALNITLTQGEGYQVYIGNAPNGTPPPKKIDLVIKNTAE